MSEGQVKDTFTASWIMKLSSLSEVHSYFTLLIALLATNS